MQNYLWKVDFSVIGTSETGGDRPVRDLDIEVIAPTTQDALSLAARRIKLYDGELIHFAHVSTPSAPPQ